MMRCVHAAGRACLVPFVEKVESMTGRMRGLLGRSGLEPGHGLLIMKCGTIHTFGMQFPIDVLFLTKEGTVTRICRDLGPMRIASGGYRASMALEIQSGWLSHEAAKSGDTLVFEPAEMLRPAPAS